MYSYEDRMRAVELYIQYDLQAEKTACALGYGTARNIQRWYKEYKETGVLHKKITREKKYSEQQKEAALNYYLEHGQNITKATKALGYPHRDTLSEWIDEAIPDRKRHCVSGGAMIECSQETKKRAVIDLCARRGAAQEVANTHGVSRVSLYRWKKNLLGEEKSTVMIKQKSPQAPDITDLEQRIAVLQAEEAALNEKLFRARLEYDILEKATEPLKKDQGINLKTLTNHEKAELVGALRGKYRLNELLAALKISKSSYCYQAKRMREPDKYSKLRTDLSNLFTAVGGCYGYRRLHALLKKSGVTVSEKVVRRLMSEEGLVVRRIKHRKYSSYIGEISPEVANIINRDFHAEQPNEKWLTDITEFSIPAGKVYLSPIIDCFDGLAVTWTIGVSPSSELVNSMLDAAIAELSDSERPIIHSDRGGHYRWQGWIERMDSAGLIRSMSKKGCSPDNSACEGFFGRLKNEMFYNRSWRGVTIEEFIKKLDAYLHWYNEDRIKESLNWMSPLEYRRSLGLCK